MFKWFWVREKSIHSNISTESDLIKITSKQNNVSEIDESFDQEKSKNLDLYCTPTSYPILLDSISTVVDLTTEHLATRDDKGILEDYFFDYLIRSFKNKIASNLRISDLNYTPDYTYIDEDNGIFFIIEVDEPYTIIEGILKPIHVMGQDDVRNKAFLQKGWKIIRFAEEQIARYPEECIKYISDSIESNNFNTLKEISCWNSTDAQEMIKIRYRDTYLPFGLPDGVRGNQQLSCHNFDVTTIQFLDQRVILHLKESEDTYLTCFIPLQLFKAKYHASNLGLLLKSKGIKLTKRDIIIFCWKLNITSIGSINQRYFNIYQEYITFKFSDDLIAKFTSRSKISTLN